MDPLTLSLIGTLGSTLVSTGYSYYRDSKEIARQKKQKIRDVETQFLNMEEEQRRFQSISGLKSPGAAQILAKSKTEALKNLT
jgi:hypothetical protein